ncbi:hypothetical protein Herbaro_09460 [Herbaspirillum sp. WKF16]|uniref:hypothetical protein n=1 Tax=Herbaspirillum sp. WKF16 TaxID=3028312 RepID=UPI0023A9E14D|nr:hypothetical protein [Herbaspirillum sp. WKF16]WDZ97987.1 hypothetical protein Herbaro_09460 [Herbaspirillum sp. WKF16]
MSLRYRAQEFLADRVSFIQYPDVRASDERGRLALPFRFVESMPWYTRAALICVGVATLLICSAAALLGIYLLKAFISGMLGD